MEKLGSGGRRLIISSDSTNRPAQGGTELTYMHLVIFGDALLHTEYNVLEIPVFNHSAILDMESV